MIGLTGAQQGKTHPHPQLGILRGPLQAFAVGTLGLLQLPLQAKHFAKMIENPALLANRQRQLPQQLLPLLRIAMVGEQHAQVLSRHGIAGLQIEGALIGRHGCFRLVVLRQHVAQVVPSLRQLGVEAHGPLQHRDRLGGALLELQGHTQIEMGSGVLWIHLHGLLQPAQRCIGALLQQGQHAQIAVGAHIVHAGCHQLAV